MRIGAAAHKQYYRLRKPRVRRCLSPKIPKIQKPRKTEENALPLKFKDKLWIYWHAILADPHYLRGFCLMAANQACDGIVFGGHMALLMTLGQVNMVLPVALINFLPVVEALVSIPCEFYFGNDTDDEVANLQKNRSVSGQDTQYKLFKYTRRLVCSSLLDVGIAVGMAVCAYGIVSSTLGFWLLAPLFVVVKVVQQVNISLEYSAYACTKANMFQGLVKKYHAKTQGISQRVEFTVHYLLSSLTRNIIFFIAWHLSLTMPAVFIAFSLGSILVGGALAGLTKYSFVLYIQASDVLQQNNIGSSKSWLNCQLSNIFYPVILQTTIKRFYTWYLFKKTAILQQLSKQPRRLS